MIYEYERAVLQYINNCFPQIRLATYSEKEDLFQAMSSVTLLPSFFYSRSSEDWTNDKLLSFTCGDLQFKGFQVHQDYQGTILVEKSVDAQDFATKLHLYWATHPTTQVSFLSNGVKKSIDVSLLLKSIKVEESQSPASSKGPLRFVTFSWWSNLFLGESTRYKYTPKSFQISLDTPQGSTTITTL